MRGMVQPSAVAWVLFLSLAFPAGSSAIDFAAATTYPVGTSPSVIVAGDFNGDGKTDLGCFQLGQQ